jgi:hypothetical protein
VAERRNWQRVLFRQGDPCAGGPTNNVELLVDPGYWGSLAEGKLWSLRHVDLSRVSTRNARGRLCTLIWINPEVMMETYLTARPSESLNAVRRPTAPKAIGRSYAD